MPVVQTRSVLGGVGAIADRFWNNLSKDQLRRMSELMEASQAALVVVAADQSDEMIQGATVRRGGRV